MVPLVPAAVGGEAAETADRRPDLERVQRHVIEEDGVALGLREHVLEQRVGEALVAVHAPQIEEDGRVQQGRRRRRADPPGELRLPFGDAQAQVRIARHDVALAQREAAGVQRLVDGPREIEQAGADALAVAAVGRQEHDAVVLIGDEPLLLARLRAEGEPAERRGEFPSRPQHRQQAPRDAAVHRRHQAHELADLHPLPEDALAEFPHLARELHQFVDAARLVDRLEHVRDSLLLRAKDVAFGHQADHLPLGALQQQMAELALRHLDAGLEHRRGVLDAARGRRHHLCHRRRVRKPLRDAARDEVGVGHDALDGIRRADEHRADPALDHQRRDVGDRIPGRHADRRRPRRRCAPAAPAPGPPADASAPARRPPRAAAGARRAAGARSSAAAPARRASARCPRRRPATGSSPRPPSTPASSRRGPGSTPPETARRARGWRPHPAMPEPDRTPSSAPGRPGRSRSWEPPARSRGGRWCSRDGRRRCCSAP